MKKTKVRTSKILLWVVSAALVAILSVSLAFMGVALNRTKNLYKTDFSDLTGLASKTVLFIGDGMGENHIKTTETYYGERAFMRSLGADGFVTTFSNNVGIPTDSAAAGSALATGQNLITAKSRATAEITSKASQSTPKRKGSAWVS